MMEFVNTFLPSITTAVILIVALLYYFKYHKKGKEGKLEQELNNLRASLKEREDEVRRTEQELKILNGRLSTFEELKTKIIRL